MAIIPSRQILSPTILLCSFVIITQFGYGLYVGWQMEPPAAYSAIHWVAQLWIIGWWLRSDSRRRNLRSVYDMGFFLSIAWPIVIAYYLLKTRGARGLLVLLGLIAVYFAAAMAGVVVSAGASVLIGH